MRAIQRKSLIFICFSLMSLYILSPFTILADEQSQTDSLEVLLKVSEGKSKIKILNELSFQLSETDPRLSIIYGEQAYELAQQLKEADLKVEALENIGRGYFSSGDFVTAIHYLTLSLEDYQELGNKLRVAKNTQNIGLAYLMSSDFVQAQNYLLKAEAQQAFELIGAIGMILPFFIPVIWLLSIRFYFKSRENLNFYLNDYN